MAVFLRRDAKRFSKFGKGNGKKASWRKPKGRDNKMREKKRGYAPVVSVGYGTDKKKEKNIIRISNIKDLVKINKEQIGFVEKMGEKKKIEIVKKAKEMKIQLKNINVESFLKNNEKKQKIKQAKKKAIQFAKKKLAKKTLDKKVASEDKTKKETENKEKIGEKKDELKK